MANTKCCGRRSCQSRVFFNRKLDGQGKPWGPATASIRAVAVADLNGDGHPDIAACPERLGCFVYSNDGKGDFSNGIQFQEPEALPHSMIAADLNVVGRPELAVGYVNSPGRNLFQ
ncbi:MAG: VCBS repeat-containing protein [Acidobacteriaceae bacterium]|nr:VCBS repeat-containing protein [Acidobacteriaceae bacterium]